MTQFTGTSKTGALVTTVLLALLALPACAPAPGEDVATPPKPTASAAEAEKAVAAAHGALVRAFESGDAEAMNRLLDPSPELLLFHPILENRFDGAHEAAEALGRMFARLGPAEWTDVHNRITVRGDTAWLTSHILMKAESLPSAFVGRGTEIWVERDGDWKLVHAHWSPHASLSSE